MPKARLLYTIAVLSLAAVLFYPDPFTRGVTAVLLLIGAIPIFKSVKESIFDDGLNDAESILMAEQERRRAARVDHESPE